MSKYSVYKQYVENGVYQDKKMETLSDSYSKQYNNAISPFDIIINSDRANTIYRNEIPYKCIVDYGGILKKTSLRTALHRQVWTKHEDSFSSGDLVEFENKESKERQWHLFLESVETKEGYDLSIMQRCNQTLRWLDEYENIVSYPCVFYSRVGDYAGIDHNTSLNLPKGDRIVAVKLDEVTENIEINQRFLFQELNNCQAFKVEGRDGMSVDGLLTIYLTKDNFAADDDKDRYIANAKRYLYDLKINESDFTQSIGFTTQLTTTLTLNGEIDDSEIEWVSSDETIATVDNDGNLQLLQDGNVTITARLVNNNMVSDEINIEVSSIPSGITSVVISPNVTEILKMSVQEYTVYKFVDNVQQTDTFTINLSGAHSSYYSFVKVDGNTFTVESLGYTSEKLIVECISDVDGSSEIIEIQLKNLW